MFSGGKLHAMNPEWEIVGDETGRIWWLHPTYMGWASSTATSRRTIDGKVPWRHARKFDNWGLEQVLARLREKGW